MKYFLFCIVFGLTSASSPRTSAHQEQLEEQYIEYYGNDIYIQREWDALRTLWFGEELQKMRVFCKEFHEASGKGSIDADELVVYMNINVLRYKGKHRCDSARIDVVKYIRNITYAPNEEGPNYYFITGGRGPQCVYYLEPTDHTCMEFYLEEHVCRNVTSSSFVNATQTTLNDHAAHSSSENWNDSTSKDS